MRNRFHSICPYFAMFPESFAEQWIGRLSKPEDVVLDPFCGRGTTPFQSLLMGRRAIACDINPVAYCITRAKTNAPSLPQLLRKIGTLESQFEAGNWKSIASKEAEFFQFAYQRNTLAQLLFLRDSLKWRKGDIDCMIAALTLGALHGESNKSSSYLSNQMPRTISTKPAYSVKYWKRHGYEAPDRDAFEILRRAAQFRYQSEPPAGNAHVLLSDMRELPVMLRGQTATAQLVVTSPPFLDITSYEEDQWLRLWFLGGKPRPTYGEVSRDDRHATQAGYSKMMDHFWRVTGRLLRTKSHVVIRIGCRRLDPERMGKRLLASAANSGRKLKLAETDVSEIKKRQTDSFRPGSQGCLIEAD